MGRFGSGLYHGCLNAPKKKLHPFPSEQVDTTIEATLTECPLCGGRLEECEKEAAVNQQIDIAPKPFIVTEYHRHGYWCPACQSYHTAPLPEGARSGLFLMSLRGAELRGILSDALVRTEARSRGSL
ncbi:MAG: IS66 family transposase zinc-finger binding domain-containing protein [Treponema sp.]|jgi:hypothetical protein|nr:IS66 family transposase zinc-finger binding domain-containing protein [Treponema sp.]